MRRINHADTYIYKHIYFKFIFDALIDSGRSDEIIVRRQYIAYTRSDESG